MDPAAKPKKEAVEQAPKEHIQTITITITSTKVQSVEKLCAELKENCKRKGIVAKGPVRIPTKTLRITTRKTPCGEGSKTWDRFQLRIYKRVMYVRTSAERVKELTSLRIDPGVELVVSFDQEE